MHGGQKSGRARLEQRLPAPGVPWEGGIAVRGTLNAVPAPRDYFSPVSARCTGTREAGSGKNIHKPDYVI